MCYIHRLSKTPGRPLKEFTDFPMASTLADHSGTRGTAILLTTILPGTRGDAGCHNYWKETGEKDFPAFHHKLTGSLHGRGSKVQERCGSHLYCWMKRKDRRPEASGQAQLSISTLQKLSPAFRNRPRAGPENGGGVGGSERMSRQMSHLPHGSVAPTCDYLITNAIYSFSLVSTLKISAKSFLPCNKKVLANILLGGLGDG